MGGATGGCPGSAPRVCRHGHVCTGVSSGSGCPLVGTCLGRVFWRVSLCRGPSARWQVCLDVYSERCVCVCWAVHSEWGSVCFCGCVDMCLCSVSRHVGTCVCLRVGAGPLVSGFCGQLCTVHVGLCTHVCLRECEILLECRLLSWCLVGAGVCVRVQCATWGAVLSCPCWCLASGCTYEPGSWGPVFSLPRPGSPFQEQACVLPCFLPLGGGNGVEAAQGAECVCFCSVAAAGCQLWWVYICL